MRMEFPGGSGLFQQDTAHIVQEWFEEHDKELKVWAHASLASKFPIEHLWDVLDQQVRSTVAPPHILQDLT